MLGKNDSGIEEAATKVEGAGTFDKKIDSVPNTHLEVQGEVNPNVASSASTAALSNSENEDAVDLIAKTETSVVRLTVINLDWTVATGSGFVVDERGTIATNYHVVDNARGVVVDFQNGEMAGVEGVLYLDRFRDIALIRAERLPTGIRPLLIEKTHPRKGERVVAIGAPLGLSFSASEGIVSATRSANEVSRLVGMELRGDWIQTTAAISKGNSGGPLINRQGKVVGLNTLATHYFEGVENGENINFAISGAELLTLYSKNRDAKIESFASLFPPPQNEPVISIDPKTLAVGVVVNVSPSANSGDADWERAKSDQIKSEIVSKLLQLGYKINDDPRRSSHGIFAGVSYFPHYSNNSLTLRGAYSCELQLVEVTYDRGVPSFAPLWQTSFEGKYYNHERDFSLILQNSLIRNLGKASKRLK